MTDARKTNYVTELIRLLEMLRRQQQDLLRCLEAKSDAMRRADVAGLAEAQHEEKVLIERLKQRDGLRRQLVERIGQELGWPQGAARALHVSRLAECLEGRERTMLIKAAHELREVVGRVARANCKVSVMSRELLNHLKWVFAAVEPKGDGPVGYAGDGSVVCSGKSSVLEEVG